MKKKVFLRALLGAPIGLSISLLVEVLISLIVGDGKFYAVEPHLAASCGSELNAVIVQMLASLLHGAAWGGSSAIWETEWSLLRQTVTHLLVCSLSALPIAYFMYWMPHSAACILTYFGIFFGIYAGIWLWQYSSMKARIRRLNEKLHEEDKE